MFLDARKRARNSPSESLGGGLAQNSFGVGVFPLVEESLFQKLFEKKGKKKKKKNGSSFVSGSGQGTILSAPTVASLGSGLSFIANQQEITAETSSFRLIKVIPLVIRPGSPGCVGTPGNGSYLQVNLRGCKKDSVNGDVAVRMSFTKLCQGVTILSFSFARGYLILPYSRFIYCISILYLFQDTNCHLAWGTEWQTTYEHHSNYSSPP